MVRTLLATSLIALLSACNTFSAVDEYRPGDAGTGDSSGDDVSIDDGGGEPPECPEEQDSGVCDHKEICGGEYLLCICGTCPAASYTYFGIDLAGGDMMFDKGTVEINAEGEISEAGGPLDGQDEESEVFGWYSRGDKHFIMLAHQTEPKLYFLLRDREWLPQRELAGEWSAVGVFSDDGGGEFRSISFDFGIDGEGDSVDDPETSLKVDGGEVLLMEGSNTWRGTLDWDRMIGVLMPTDGEGLLIIGQRSSDLFRIKEIDANWHGAFVSFAPRPQWTAFADEELPVSEGRFRGELKRISESIDSPVFDGLFERNRRGRWVVSPMEIESDGVHQIDLSGWHNTGVNTMVGGAPEGDDPILNVWIQAD